MFGFLLTLVLSVYSFLLVRETAITLLNAKKNEIPPGDIFSFIIQIVVILVMVYLMVYYLWGRF